MAELGNNVHMVIESSKQIQNKVNLIISTMKQPIQYIRQKTSVNCQHWYLCYSETVGQSRASCVQRCCSMVARYEIFACSGYTQRQREPSSHDLVQSRNCLNIHKSITKYTFQQLQIEIYMMNCLHNTIYCTNKTSTLLVWVFPDTRCDHGPTTTVSHCQKLVK